MEIDPRLRAEVSRQPYPLLFATISGAHLYGFPSPDSDYDLRGTHILPLREVVGLDRGPETLEVSRAGGGIQLDLVTHDVGKFFSLLLKKNGYVLEQLYSPLVVLTRPEHLELKDIAHGCMTRHHSHHYLGFAAAQWQMLEKERPPRVKTLLYVYRVLLTGIYLMRTGEVEANLAHLNAEFNLPYLDELVARKIEGAERSDLGGDDLSFHQREYDRLREVLVEASARSALPEMPSTRAALNDLLIRLRMDQNPAGSGGDQCTGGNQQGSPDCSPDRRVLWLRP
jgi:predicted nucleotidyltransferase